MAETITEDGEVITTGLAQIEAGISIGLARAEIDTLVATARQYPRSMTVAQRRMMELATMDEEAADEAIYSLPRGGKTIEGPSIRFAEMAAQSFGNCRVAARTVEVNRVEKYVEAEGIFLDAETNVATLARVRRRIVDSKGRLYNDDMIIVTSNAAQSIARRNAILAGIPKAVWKKPYEAARLVIMGDIQTLANRRAEAIKAFQRFGITAEQVFQLLGVKGEEDIDQEKLVPLRGMFSALRNGETTVEELLRQIAPVPNHKIVANPLADVPPAEQPAKPTEVQSSPKAKEPTKEQPATEAKKDAPTGGEEEGAQKAAAAAQDAPSGDGKPKTLDPIEIARERGREARRKGMARKAMPPEYREEARKAEADAWLAGYDEGDGK